MEIEKLEQLLIDYIDGNLSSEEKREIEIMLSEKQDAAQLHEELKLITSLMDNSKTLPDLYGHETTFAANLKSELDAIKNSKIVLFHPIIYRVAAAVALVVAGVAAGFWISKNNQQEKELAALKSEMVETKQLMMAMLSNGQSASERMQGVNVAFTIPKADDDVVLALARAMSTDVNTNVRLAALEALSQFVDEPKVRMILTSSLTTQDDPMVQIALIQLLVRIKEKNIVNDLERIINEDRNMQVVKDEAYTGIIKLS